MKIQKKKQHFFLWGEGVRSGGMFGGGGVFGGGGGGSQDGCEQRIDVFVKIQKKWGSPGRGGGSGWGVRVDVNEECL